MREIDVKEITNSVKEALIKACEVIPSNVKKALEKALSEETDELSKKVLSTIILNDELALTNHLPICQDTGIVVCFVEIGYDVHLNGDLYEAINEGVRAAYTEGYLRKSVVKDPLNRINTHDNTPAIIHVEFVKGDKITIRLAPKGAGSENMSFVKMLTPAYKEEDIIEEVVKAIKEAGGKPCPPLVVGIGIGGDLEKAALLAKRAIFRELDDTNENEYYNSLEQKLKTKINETLIGPMGYGGKTTCLAVKINYYPCHIASLPLAVNIQCHAARHKTIII